MKSMLKGKLLRVVFVVSAMVAAPAGAVVVSITVSGPDGCDPLFISSVPWADELGSAYTFPVGEQIGFFSIDTNLVACVASDDDQVPNKLVSITNLQAFPISDIYYVANGGSVPGTFSNFDGYINGSMAMKVDHSGNNLSLYSESLITDGIFQPSETWQFIVQDYVSPVPVDAFFSPRVVGGADTLPSIIVPEPSTVGLGLLGGLLMLRRRR